MLWIWVARASGLSKTMVISQPGNTNCEIFVKLNVVITISIHLKTQSNITHVFHLCKNVDVDGNGFVYSMYMPKSMWAFISFGANIVGANIRGSKSNNH